MTDTQRVYVPAKTLNTPYPLIDSDPFVSYILGEAHLVLRYHSHFRRVLRYARPSDYAAGAGLAALPPGLMLLWEQVAPSHVGKGGFAPIMRLTVACGAMGGFLMLSQRSTNRFYGFRDNKREVEMDMREMVEKVKKGEPLYGKSSLTPYMQGVASRNSRYSGVWLHILPMFNFVNHEQHGVDTAKYYQQAERELDAERNQDVR